jgi:hypothetical protein
MDLKLRQCENVDQFNLAKNWDVVMNLQVP